MAGQNKLAHVGCAIVLNKEPKLTYFKKREAKRSPYLTKPIIAAAKPVDGVAHKGGQSVTVYSSVYPQKNNRIMAAKTSVFFPKKMVKIANHFE